jgi:hypothetical protein
LEKNKNKTKMNALQVEQELKMKSEQIAKLQNYLKEEIIEATQLYIAMNAPRAAMAVVSGIADPTELGLKEKLNAAEDLLDRAGLVKTDKVQIETPSGIMILPAKDKSE